MCDSAGDDDVACANGNPPENVLALATFDAQRSVPLSSAKHKTYDSSKPACLPTVPETSTLSPATNGDPVICTVRNDSCLNCDGTAAQLCLPVSRSTQTSRVSGFDATRYCVGVGSPAIAIASTERSVTVSVSCRVRELFPPPGSLKAPAWSVLLACTHPGSGTPLSKFTA